MRTFMIGIVVTLSLTCFAATGTCAKEPTIGASSLKVPLSFIKNEGQKDPSILYFEQGKGHFIAVTREGISVFLTKHAQAEQKLYAPELVTLGFLTSSSYRIEALDKKKGMVNFFIGNDPKKWKTDIPTYGAIFYRNIYPGIDMKFYGTDNNLEYDIIVSPQGDPSKIRLSYKGIEGISLTPTGDLKLHLKEGSLLQKKPRIYQTIEGTRKEIEGKFVLVDTTTYSFSIDPYDKAHALVIDPVLVYSTYLGGNTEEIAFAIAVDSSGNTYVTGYTRSPDFPTKDPYQGALTVNMHAFVTKLDSSGTSLIYSTYLGGNTGWDEGYGIATDSSGNAYVAGVTCSADFPTQNAYQGTLKGFADAFITKLSPDGNALIYSTFLGGSGSDGANAIAVDPSGNAYVAGGTDSTDFPIKDAYQGTLKNGFLTKLSPEGNDLIYSTYFGGCWGDAIAVDSSGNVYVAGSTSFTDFATPNAFQESIKGPVDGCVAKLSPEGNALVYATYLGGSSYDGAWAIAVDSSGNAYIAGQTQSTDFPTKNAYQGPYQGSLKGAGDAFITKLSPEGNSLIYSTYLGGESTDEARAIGVDFLGYASIAGRTWSSNFPTRHAFQGSLKGKPDAFVTKLTPSGNISGNSFTIPWTTHATKRPVESVDLFLTKNGGVTWKLVDTVTGNPGAYAGTVPSVSVIKRNCKVKVILKDAAGMPIGSDVSDSYFTIRPVQ